MFTSQASLENAIFALLEIRPANWQNGDLRCRAAWHQAETAYVHLQKSRERRASDRNDIDMRFGAPGENHTSDIGKALILELLDHEGLDGLNDDALRRLAVMHREMDNWMEQTAR